MGELRRKTISGLFWSFSENGINQMVNLIIGIILARLLSPTEFGLIGMILFFIAISQTIIDTGFSQALIRKTDAHQSDYSTVFYFNLSIGIVLYIIMFFSASGIGKFFNEPILEQLLKFIGVILILNAFSIIQRTILIKNINFKLQAKITIIASVISGLVGIILAYKGFGVWSLAIRMVLNQFCNSLFLWIYNRWTPTLEFSIKSFKEMFSFGSKLLVSGLINTMHQNVYYLIIGKFFSATALGYYTRANQFSNQPSSNINASLQKVTYPVFSKLQNESSKLKYGFKKMIKSIMLINFAIMLGLAAIAQPLILTLLGDKWLPVVIYLQLLCFVSMTLPLHSLNLDILRVKGRSDLFLRLEIIKVLLSIPAILIGIFVGIIAMIITMIVSSFVAYFINSYYSSRLIDYSIKEQIKDILPEFSVSFCMAATIFIIQMFTPFSSILKLVLCIPLGIGIVITFSKIFNIAGYVELNKTIREFLWGKQAETTIEI